MEHHRFLYSCYLIYSISYISLTASVKATGLYEDASHRSNRFHSHLPYGKVTKVEDLKMRPIPSGEELASLRADVIVAQHERLEVMPLGIRKKLNRSISETA